MILRSEDAASAHTALAAVLVWIDPAFGVFVYVGFLYSYGLGPRWRIAGFTATALVVSAALSGGYPSGRTGPTLAYILIAAVLMALVFNTARITALAVDQNAERGRMIAELPRPTGGWPGRSTTRWPRA